MTNIGIIGVGKLGLSYALTFEKSGCKVWASSYKQDYIEDLRGKIIDSVEPGVSDLLSQSQNIIFTTDNHAVIDNCDIIYVMVATPSLPEGNYDISAIDQVVKDFLNHQSHIRDKILVIGSTVNPGDCDQLQKKLDSVGVHVVYCPTFAAQGTVLHDIQNPIAISLGTANDSVAQQVRKAFASIIPDDTPVHQLLPMSAEILKLAANCYSTLRINFYNLVGRMIMTSGSQQDIDKANQYLNAVDRKKHILRFGFGYGGPCYPRDNRSLKHFTDSINVPNQLCEINDKVNIEHADFLTQWLVQNNKENLPFYFDYISYKPGVRIFEESHQLMICERLLQRGYEVIVGSSQFLDMTVIHNLNDRYPNQISVKHKDILGDSELNFFPVDF